MTMSALWAPEPQNQRPLIRYPATPSCVSRTASPRGASTPEAFRFGEAKSGAATSAGR